MNEAQAVVDGLVQRRAPLVQMFGDFPKILRTDLSGPMKALVLLYRRGGMGASTDGLAQWLRIESKEARRILRRHDSASFVHYEDASNRGTITLTGIAEVEGRVRVLEVL